MARGARTGWQEAAPLGSAFPTRLPTPQTWAAWQAVTLLGSARGSPPLGGRAHRGWTLEERERRITTRAERAESVLMLLGTGGGRAGRGASGCQADLGVKPVGLTPPHRHHLEDAVITEAGKQGWVVAAGGRGRTLGKGSLPGREL